MVVEDAVEPALREVEVVVLEFLDVLVVDVLGVHARV